MPAGVKTCAGCRQIKALDPGAIKTSCGGCGLNPDNNPARDLDGELMETWRAACEYKGMFRTAGRRIAVDLPAAGYMAGLLGVADPLWFLSQLEAIARGVNDGQ